MTDKPKRKSSTAQVNQSRKKAFAQRRIYREALQQIANSGNSKNALFAREVLFDADILVEDIGSQMTRKELEKENQNAIMAEDEVWKRLPSGVSEKHAVDKLIKQLEDEAE